MVVGEVVVTARGQIAVLSVRHKWAVFWPASPTHFKFGPSDRSDGGSYTFTRAIPKTDIHNHSEMMIYIIPTPADMAQLMGKYCDAFGGVECLRHELQRGCILTSAAPLTVVRRGMTTELIAAA